jgi:hypothetical protein
MITSIAIAAGLALVSPAPTHVFSIRADRPMLDGQEIDLWGIRCSNALMSDAVTERLIRNFDNWVDHGINCVGVYVQGSNGGWPDVDAGPNGFTNEGSLRPEFARRLEWLVREADTRAMVVMVGLISPRKDQFFINESAIRRAVEETATFLASRGLRNVFCDLCHEYNCPRIDQEILREPNGAEKKAKLTAWFKACAPDVPVGVCPTFEGETADAYPGMDVRIIQKGAAIPDTGFVVNVETTREDLYEDEGLFDTDARQRMLASWERYLAKPNAVMLFHSAYTQGITGKEGTGPHPEMGGNGTGPNDRGVRFYFDWVREHVGPWRFPKPAAKRT